MENNALEERKLERGIRSWHLSLIALGGIIGSGYFLGSGYVVAEVGPAAIFSYLIAGFIIFAFMMSFGELLVNLPRQGSYVSYARELLGEKWAIAVGWGYWISWTAFIPCEAIGFGILMNVFIPWNEFYWGMVCLAVLTVLNLLRVEFFASIQSGLALIKILAIALFTICAIGILFGWIGGEAVGTSILFNPDAGTGFLEQLFPYGGVVVLSTMVIVICNYGGTEIVGIAAAEAQNPEISVPKACKSVTYRIIVIYIIPVILLCMILPFQEAGLTDSVFSTALAKYGIGWAAALFTFITLTAAFSCACAGVYSTARTLYSLSHEGLAPKQFGRLNRYNVPQFATVFTIFFAWAVMCLGYFMPTSSFYAWLLAMTGFLGTLPWMAIMLSQLVMRRKLKQKGYVPDQVLKARSPLFPVVPIIGILLILGSLLFMVFQPDLQSAFVLAIISLGSPVVLFSILKRKGKIRKPEYTVDELTFEERFPSVKK